MNKYAKKRGRKPMTEEQKEIKKLNKTIETLRLAYRTQQIKHGDLVIDNNYEIEGHNQLKRRVQELEDFVMGLNDSKYNKDIELLAVEAKIRRIKDGYKTS